MTFAWGTMPHPLPACSSRLATTQHISGNGISTAAEAALLSSRSNGGKTSIPGRPWNAPTIIFIHATGGTMIYCTSGKVTTRSRNPRQRPNTSRRMTLPTPFFSSSRGVHRTILTTQFRGGSSDGFHPVASISGPTCRYTWRIDLARTFRDIMLTSLHWTIVVA